MAVAIVTIPTGDKAKDFSEANIPFPRLLLATCASVPKSINESANSALEAIVDFKRLLYVSSVSADLAKFKSLSATLPVFFSASLNSSKSTLLSSTASIHFNFPLLAFAVKSASLAIATACAVSSSVNPIAAALACICCIVNSLTPSEPILN